MLAAARRQALHAPAAARRGGDAPGAWIAALHDLVRRPSRDARAALGPHRGAIARALPGAGAHPELAAAAADLFGLRADLDAGVDPVTGLPWRVRRSGSRVVMRLVPGGDHAVMDDPGREVTVEVDPFYADVVPVTVADFLRWVDAVGDRRLEPIYLDRDLGDHRVPVTRVPWRTARRFCAWAGGRLPSECEWERVTSGIGLVDAAEPAGVAEWCQDHYREHRWPRAGQRNPVAQGEGALRVVRRPTTIGPPEGRRPPSRDGASERRLVAGLGFRVVVPLFEADGV